MSAIAPKDIPCPHPDFTPVAWLEISGYNVAAYAYLSDACACLVLSPVVTRVITNAEHLEAVMRESSLFAARYGHVLKVVREHGGYVALTVEQGGAK